MYERHLQSALHLRRTLPERQLDVNLDVNLDVSAELEHNKPGKRLRVRTFKLAVTFHLNCNSGRSLSQQASPRATTGSSGSPGSQGGAPARALAVGQGQGHGQGNRRAERCVVCRARVLRHQVGKHLVSHFHWRSTRRHALGSPLGSPLAVGSAAANLVLDNIEAVVRQSPFQCGLCSFYCNSSDVFREHWASAMHRRMDDKARG